MTSLSIGYDVKGYKITQATIGSHKMHFVVAFPLNGKKFYDDLYIILFTFILLIYTSSQSSSESVHLYILA